MRCRSEVPNVRCRGEVCGAVAKYVVPLVPCGAEICANSGEIWGFPMRC